MFLLKLSSHKILYLWLIASLVVTLVILTFLKPIYNYDEYILIAISQKPIHQLIDTIRVEPHPPGFYLFLKFLPIANHLLTKTIITMISYTLLLCGIISFKKPIQKLHLLPGLLLWFVSPTHFKLTTTIKQDALTYPLFFVFFLLVTSLIDTELTPKIHKKHKLLLLLFPVIFLFFGYVYYLWALLLLLVLSLMRKEPFLRINLITQIIIGGLYQLIFGFEQILNNYDRFTWIKDSSNSILVALSVHLTGSDISDYFSDISCLLFLGLVFLGLYSLFSKKNKYKNTFSVFILMLLLLVVPSYLNHWLARSRYVAFPFLLTTLVAGVGLSKLYKHNKAFLLILFCFLSIGLRGFILTNISDKTQLNKIASFVKTAEIEGQVGVINSHPNAFPWFLKQVYFSDSSSIMPLNHAFVPLSDTLDRTHLEIDQDRRYKSPEPDAIYQAIQLNNISQFVYIYTSSMNNMNLDRRTKMITALSTVCKRIVTEPLGTHIILFAFQDCHK